jgi:hypothetical protein
VQGGFGPRFALEAGFLIAIAIAAGVAQLSATVIVVVMAVAWVLVCLFELAVWAEGPRFPRFTRERVEEAVEVEEKTDPDSVVPASDPEPVAVSEADGERG